MPTFFLLIMNAFNDFVVGHYLGPPLFSIPLKPSCQIVKEEQLIFWFNDWLQHFIAKIKFYSTAVPLACD